MGLIVWPPCRAYARLKTRRLPDYRLAAVGNLRLSPRVMA
jgi:hypothetical protein